jgi:hypothetical protein
VSTSFNVCIRYQPRYRPAQWLLYVHKDVSQHACTIVFVIVGHPVRDPGLRPVLSPQPTAPAHGRNSEPTNARRHGGASQSEIRWHLPCLGYLGNKESRSEILDNQRPVARQHSTYATKLVVVLYRLGGSRAGKALAFSRFSRTNAWCGCLSVWSCSDWASFSACMLSLSICM